ncbi:uncharacterized protein LOC142175898 [Nicotiana tabacum]|uniref:Uncharacterized protein LOC142175898 n=1 Tax=Nicotiana tabacum TaxID=4097 RepID=A0AC58TP54_TOBAC
MTWTCKFFLAEQTGYEGHSSWAAKDQVQGSQGLEDMARTILIHSGVPKSFWVEAVNTARYLINRYMIRSLLEKNPYELLNGKKPKLTYLRAFGCKYLVVNNGNYALENLMQKVMREFFFYSCQTKAYKVYNKRTQCLEESVHVIFDESHESRGKGSHKKEDEDGEFSKVPDEAIDIVNGKSDLISQVKQSDEEDATESPEGTEEPSPSIISTEAEQRVVDAVSGTLDARKRSGSHTSVNVNDGTNMEEPGPSNPEVQVFNWKRKSLSRNFESHEHPNHVFKLDKTLYGLKQAPRAWYERLSKFLLENGFTRGKIDNTQFMKKRGRNLLIVQVYVDDIIFGATNDCLCEKFAKLMGSEFEMSMIGERNFFLGLQVKQTSKGTMISQHKYVNELLKIFEMENANTIDTPIATSTRLDMDEPNFSVNETIYRGISGSFLYLNASRLDIIFSVGLCARFQ